MCTSSFIYDFEHVIAHQVVNEPKFTHKQQSDKRTSTLSFPFLLYQL